MQASAAALTALIWPASPALAGPVCAKVVKFEVVRIESPAFEGRTFGAVGTYDRIIARATIAVSPDDPHNTIIVDLDRAPRNAQGLVEAVTDVEILRPTVAANGNRRLFYEVLNRGNKLALGAVQRCRVTVNDLAKAADAGNGFLMNRGYTVVWSGWQGDVAPGGGRMTFSPPVVTGVTGLAREDFIFDHIDNPAIATLSYPAADLDPAKAKTHACANARPMRAPRPPICHSRSRAPNKISIQRPDGFDAGAIYEFIYTAKDPKVMGLGFAATRDIVSFLRTRDRRVRAPIPSPAGSTAPSAGAPRRAAATCTTFSISASTPTRPAARVRRPDAAHLRRQEDLHQLPLQPARPLALPARRHAVSRRRLSVQLSGDHGRADRQDRRLSQALPRRQQLPEDHQDRQRARILSAARLAGGDRHARAMPLAMPDNVGCSCFRTCSISRWPTPNPKR